MYARFRKDPYLLQRYNVQSTLILATLTVAIAFVRGDFAAWWPWLPVTILYAHSSFRSVLWSAVLAVGIFFVRPESFHAGTAIACLVLGIYVGIWSNVLIHNCSHNMIKPAWLNRLVGELAGLQVLSGFPGFAVIHIEHHRHSDDEELDPHPNMPGQTFWEYINDTRARLRQTFARMYRESWGKDPAHLASWRKVRFLLPLNRSLRAALLLVVLGPMGFTFGFITSHIATQVVFALINFYSHRRREDGTVEVLNLDEGWAYWIMNRCFAGAFYHRNHHVNPKLFNPMKLRGQRG